MPPHAEPGRSATATHKAQPGTAEGPAASPPADGGSVPAGAATRTASADAPVLDTKLRAVATRPGTYSQQTHEAVTSAVKADADTSFKAGQVAGLNGSASPAAVRMTDDLNGAQQASAQSWNSAHAAISADLSAQGNGKLDADRLTHRTVRAINNIAPHSANLRAATQGAYDERVKSWEAQGTTSAALDRLGTQVKAAQADPTGQAWKPVADKVSTVLNGGLVQGNQPVGHLPQDTALSLKHQLDARFRSPALTQVSEAAYQDTSKTLTSLGLDNAQFAPTQAAFKQYHRAQADYAGYLAAHGLPAGSAAARPGSAQDLLLQRVQQGWDSTSSAIQGQMRTAQANATANGATPQARAAMMSSVTQAIGVSGPQTEDFQANAAFSDWDLRVNKPAQAVQAAYDNQRDPAQGAVHASGALVDQMAAAGDPQYAAMILSRSNPTVVQIGQQAGQLAAPGHNSPRTGAANPQLLQIYSSMSKAAESVNFIQETPLQARAVQQTAQAMLDGLPPDPARAGHPYSAAGWTAKAVQAAIGAGDGAALGMGMAAAAEQGGRGVEQGRIMDGITGGLDTLRTRIGGDVDALATTVAGLPQVISTWDTSATPEQKQAALRGFEERTPGFKEQAAAVNADGIAAGQVASAWHNFGQGLQGVDARAELGGAVQALSGGDTKVAAAIASSDWLSNNVWANAAVQAGTRPGNTPVAYLSGGFSVLKNSKGFIKSGHLLTTNKFSPTGQWVQEMTNLPASINGRFLTGVAAVGAGFYATSGTLQDDPAKRAYNYLGASKEAVEVYARLSATGAPIRSIFAGVQEESQPGISAVTGRTTAWNGFGAALGIAGTVFDVQGALKAERQGDNFARTANWLAAGGDAVSTLNSLVQTGSNLARVAGRTAAADALASVTDGVLGTVGLGSIGLGPVALAGGAVALGASVAVLVHQRSVEREAVNKESARFLEDGLGVPAPAAEVLGQVATNGSSPVLDTLARQTGQSRQQVIQTLGSKDPARLKAFISRASSMAQQHPDGRYPREPIRGRGHPSLSMNDLVAEYRGL